MANLFKKVSQMLLGEEYDYDDEDSYVDEYEDEIVSLPTPREREVKERSIKEPSSAITSSARPPSSTGRRYRNPLEEEKIVRIHTDVQLEIVVLKPDVVEDATIIADYLRDNKSCVINLEGVDNENAQRTIDFLSGAAYALNGDVQRISNDIFLVAPMNVNISGKLKEELKSSGYIFPRVPASF